MISFLISQFRSLLGGGASYFFLALGAAMVFQYWQISELREDQRALMEERDVAIEQAKEKDTVIASQSRQYRRQIETRKDEADAENTINTAPDSHNCIHSASIGSALEWLREHEDGAAENDNDRADVRVPGEARPSEQ